MDENLSVNILLHTGTPIFGKLAQFLKKKDKSCFDLSLFEQFCSEIEQFKRVLLAQNVALEKVLYANYALTALIDDAILHSDWVLKDQWQGSTLQMKFFAEHHAGEGFYNRLAELRQHPKGRVDLIEFFYICMALGFKGLYRVLSHEKYQNLLSAIGHQLILLRNFQQTTLEIPLKPNSAPESAPQKNFPRWSMALIALSVCTLAFWLLKFSADIHTNKVLKIARNEDPVVFYEQSKNYSHSSNQSPLKKSIPHWFMSLT